MTRYKCLSLTNEYFVQKSSLFFECLQKVNNLFNLRIGPFIFDNNSVIAQFLKTKSITLSAIRGQERYFTYRALNSKYKRSTRVV